MVLTDETIVEEIKVLKDGTLKVMELKNILRDGVVVAHEKAVTKTITPDKDVSAEKQLTKDVALNVFTKARKDAYVAVELAKSEAVAEITK